MGQLKSLDYPLVIKVGVALLTSTLSVRGAETRTGGPSSASASTNSSSSSFLLSLSSSSFSFPRLLLLLLLLFLLLQTARLSREGLPNTLLSPVLQLGWWQWEGGREDMRTFGKGSTTNRRLSSSESQGWIIVKKRDTYQWKRGTGMICTQEDLKPPLEALILGPW